MLPSAAAAAAGFMTHGLPPMPGGMMLPPGYVLPNGMAPVPGGWPMPPPGMAAGAHVHPFMPPPLPGVAGMPGLAWNGMTMPWSGNTAAARYMVQVGVQCQQPTAVCTCYSFWALCKLPAAACRGQASLQGGAFSYHSVYWPSTCPCSPPPPGITTKHCRT
jgi:hypothetical protein